MVGFDPGSLIVGAFAAGTIIAYAALGENVSEISGVYNIGTEGTMLLSASTSFLGALITNNPYMGLAVGLLTGALIGIVQSVFAIKVRADQIVFGLGLILFGTFTSTVIANTALHGRNSYSEIPSFPTLAIQGLPYPLGLILKQNFLFYLVFVVAIGLWLLLSKTKFGLAARAVGENAHVAASAGLSPTTIRYICTIAGSIIASLGGVFAIFLYSIWGDNLTGGRGFIAIAMVRVGLFRPIYVLLASLAFGLVDSFQLYFSAVFGRSFPYQFFAMIPYAAGIIVLLISTQFKIFKEPAELGKPYSGESR